MASSRPRASASFYDSSAMRRLAANQHRRLPSSPARSLDSKAWGLRARSDLPYPPLPQSKPKAPVVAFEFRP